MSVLRPGLQIGDLPVQRVPVHVAVVGSPLVLQKERVLVQVGLCLPTSPVLTPSLPCCKCADVVGVVAELSCTHAGM